MLGSQPKPESQPVGLNEWWPSSESGGLPIVLSVPHDGDAAPAHLPDRADGCLLEDAGTRALGHALHTEFGHQAGGAQPHMVVCRLHRRKLDANRPRALAAEADAALGCWDCYHAWLEAALRETVAM